MWFFFPDNFRGHLTVQYVISQKLSGFMHVQMVTELYSSPKLIVVNGGWSSWGRWSSCSRTCGTGSRNRYRRCSNPPPRNGGRSCIGTSRQSTSCTIKPCPGKNELLKTIYAPNLSLKCYSFFRKTSVAIYCTMCFLTEKTRFNACANGNWII